jgi:hypothetical protein
MVYRMLNSADRKALQYMQYYRQVHRFYLSMIKKLVRQLLAGKNDASNT